MDLSNFDPDSVEPAVAYEPLPAGWYKAVITESEEKPTKAQTGSYLQLTLEVIDGAHQGRKLIDRLNLENPNETARNIAARALSAICHAVKVKPRESSDLHDKPLMVKVKVKPGSGEYGPSNEVAGYEATSAAAKATLEAAGKPVPRWPPVRQS